MTQEALAGQRLWAAWLSAVAACVQAAGAIGAIMISVKLARDSAQREIDAQRRSEAREIAAEAAANARADAVEAGNILRDHETSAGEREALIAPIISAANLTKDRLLRDAADLAASDFKPMRAGSLLTNEDTASLLRTLREVKVRVKDPRLALAMLRLDELIDPNRDLPKTRSHDQYIADKRRLVNKIVECAEQIEDCNTIN